MAADYEDDADDKPSEYSIPVTMQEKIENVIERFIFESRWILIPLFLGLIVALAGFSINFCYLVFKFTLDLFLYEKNELLLMILTFVDKVLVGSLIVMVLIGGYENAVSKINVANNKKKLSWLGKVDSSSLKIKLSTSIVSISSIHLLKIFLNVEGYSQKELAWTTGIHFVMVLTAILLAYMDTLKVKK